jgi:hypothetical protein
MRHFEGQVHGGAAAPCAFRARESPGLWSSWSARGGPRYASMQSLACSIHGIQSVSIAARQALAVAGANQLASVLQLLRAWLTQSTVSASHVRP